MLRKFVSDSGMDLIQWIPFSLFAVREVPQASTGFARFELLYRQQPRGVLDILEEEWEMPPQVEEAPTSYLEALRKKLWASALLAPKELQSAQGEQKRWYNAQVKPCSFSAGQKVLLLLPFSSNVIGPMARPLRGIRAGRQGELPHSDTRPANGVTPCQSLKGMARDEGPRVL